MVRVDLLASYLLARRVTGPFDFAYLKRVVAMTLRPRSPTQTITQGPNQSPPRHHPPQDDHVGNS